MNEEQIKKAKDAQSAEELLALAQEYGIENFTEKDAEDLYAQLHTSGELTDEELENVSGGGCSVKVNGRKYTLLTCDKKCFTNKFVENLNLSLRDDHLFMRDNWMGCSLGDNVCGRCGHLGFQSGLGYCEVEFE